MESVLDVYKNNPVRSFPMIAILKVNILILKPSPVKGCPGFGKKHPQPTGSESPGQSTNPNTPPSNNTRKYNVVDVHAEIRNANGSPNQNQVAPISHRTFITNHHQVS